MSACPFFVFLSLYSTLSRPIHHQKPSARLAFVVAVVAAAVVVVSQAIVSLTSSMGLVTSCSISRCLSPVDEDDELAEAEDTASNTVDECCDEPA